MWLLVILASILPSTIMGLAIDGVNLSISYFKYKEVKFICLLSCHTDAYWSLMFYKSASSNSIAISEVYLNQPGTDFDKVQQCLEYGMHSIGVFLDAYCEGANDVLYFASENLSFSAQHKWLIIADDDAISEYYNSTGINNVIYEQNSTIGVLGNLNISVDADIIVGLRAYKKIFLINLNLLPLSLECVKVLIDAISEYYNSTGINNVIYEQNSTIGVLGNLNISVDADIIVGLRANSGYYTLYDVFNFGKIQGGNLIVNEIGLWDMENGLRLDFDLNEYKYYRRWDFQKWTMRMILGVTPAPKKFDLKMLSSPQQIPGVAVVTHTAGAILCLIAEMHNFRFIHTFTDRWIGTFEKNSTRVVANSLYFREQDISPVIRFISTVHDKIDILIPPLTSIETRYYYRIPTKGPGKFENQFLMPLSPVAWWGVIGVSVLCAFLLLLSARLEQRPSTVQYAVFSVIASICQQFYEDCDENGAKRVSTARKVTILVTGLSCVLIYNYYTSSVVSWLLNGPPPSINSLKELLDSPLELIYEDIGYTRSWLQTPSYYYNKRNAPIEDALRQKKVFNKKKDAPLLEPLVQGIRMVQKGGYAYHTEVNSANALISRTFDQEELCELGSLQSMEQTPLYPAVPKNSPYKEFLTWSLMRLLERGFVSCIQARTASPEAKCEGSSPRALALGGAAPAFILLAGGYLLATLIMLIERFVYKMKNNNVVY